VPHAYNVLGWYFITEMWCELDEHGFKTYKIKAQAVDPTRPWFASVENAKEPMPEIGEYKAALGKCDTCQEVSKQLFTIDWVCLNKGCPEFFKFSVDIDNKKLVYADSFLLERQVYHGMEPLSAGGDRIFPPSIMPALPVQGPDDFGTEKHLRAGFVCPDCGGCNSRKNWYGWVYETPDCQFKLECNMKPVPIDMVRKENDKFAKKRFNVDKMFEGLTMEKKIGNYKATIFALPDPNANSSDVVGVVVHLRPDDLILANEMGADETFAALHDNAKTADWKRLPVRHKGRKYFFLVSWNRDAYFFIVKAQILTKHFVQNYGAPYKYVVDVPSVAFEDAPATILAALMRMRWAANTAIKEAESMVSGFKDHQAAGSLNWTLEEFNELLALGYFEEDQIGVSLDILAPKPCGLD
jgi:hypothetical protein